MSRMNAQLVISHQLQGVMFHHDMMLAYAVLDKPCKCREQRKHMYAEMKNLDKTNFAVIKSTGKIVDPGPLTRVKLPDVSSTMTEEQKATACRALLDAWKAWEKSTVDLYHQELMADPQNKWLKCLMHDAERELKHVEWVLQK